jgi:hypothetical protein
VQLTSFPSPKGEPAGPWTSGPSRRQLMYSCRHLVVRRENLPASQFGRWRTGSADSWASSRFSTRSKRRGFVPAFLPRLHRVSGPQNGLSRTGVASLSRCRSHLRRSGVSRT